MTGEEDGAGVAGDVFEAIGGAAFHGDDVGHVAVEEFPGLAINARFGGVLGRVHVHVHCGGSIAE